MRKRNQGFSLIKLLIVVAIILIIAAIAIPNLLKSKMAANQASAVASLRTLNTSEITYSSTYNQGFSRTWLSWGRPLRAPRLRRPPAWLTVSSQPPPRAGTISLTRPGRR